MEEDVDRKGSLLMQLLRRREARAGGGAAAPLTKTRLFAEMLAKGEPQLPPKGA